MTILEYAIEANIILNLVLSLIIIIWDLYFYFKMDEKEKWTKILYVLVGIGWFMRYVLYLMDFKPFTSYNPYLIALVTFTLVSLAVGSIIRVQRLVGFDEMKDDAHTLVKGIKAWTSKTFSRS